MKTNETLNSAQLQKHLQSEVVGIVSVLRDKQFTVGFAESCTGGLLSSYFTELAGVSDVFTGSIISYDNSVKQKFLQVETETLKQHGAVSAACAIEMANGVKAALGTSVAVSITGIAGPSGGSAAKPVGTVFIAVAGPDLEDRVRDVEVFQHLFTGERKVVQFQSCIEAIKHLNKFINGK